MFFHLEFERRLLEDLPEEVESELLAVEHVIALVSLDVFQPQLQLGLDLVQRFHQSSKNYCCMANSINLHNILFITSDTESSGLLGC